MPLPSSVVSDAASFSLDGTDARIGRVASRDDTAPRSSVCPRKMRAADARQWTLAKKGRAVYPVAFVVSANGD